jgi:hypothetical protein
MDIQIDSREKAKAITKILAEFDRQNITYDTSKLIVGDYMNLDNPRLIVDRKQSLSELYTNLCPNKKTNPKDANGKLRIDREVERANRLGIKIVFLVEHGGTVKTLEDVRFWKNPRLKETPYAWDGEKMYHEILLFSKKHNVDFYFCDKRKTGARILELLA